MSLRELAFGYPAIDNHAHPLLKEGNRSELNFDGVISEAQGPALTEDAIHTLACYRATKDLSRLYGIFSDKSTWKDVKDARAKISYDELCRKSFEPANIQTLLLDDGLGGVGALAEPYGWHDKLVKSPCKRIARVEPLAEDLLRQLIEAQLQAETLDPISLLESFSAKLEADLTTAARAVEVVGFKSAVCYRTGLAIALRSEWDALQSAVIAISERYQDSGSQELRLQDKPLNDLVVRVMMEVAGKFNKPVQFHTGLGDNDLMLSLSNPSLLQPLIAAYPGTQVVLLHASYPFTREAGYLAAMYKNVYLDFGEVFPFVSALGQQRIMEQVLELCPTTKALWSTDGHWWPESFYLASLQSRQAMYMVLKACVEREEMSENQAIEAVKQLLFENANKLYQLDLQAQYP